MNHFIVMQGHTYLEEKELEIIWSPKKDRGGNVPHSWKRMMDVKEGDRIFHYVKGNIVAVSIAEEDCKESNKPSIMKSHEQWNDEGYLVSLKYHELEKPINIREKFEEISQLLPIKYSPFQSDAKGNQGYLYPCNEELALKLIELISDLNIYEKKNEQLELSVDEVRRTENNTLIPVISETESEVKATIRIGQQKFRKALMELWNGKCALCGINLPELLRASHSKPWKDSTSMERLNSYNGVLLCCNHDALYDKGFITFDGQGRLHISLLVVETDYLIFGLRPKAKIEIHPENKLYFKWHKRNIFKTN
ncbi:restriction endonuclease [Bacillus cereus]|uniref:HNH endonuclease n=1 Tax=Bacillus cereus TaxID=1396 RepID=UPI000BF9CC5D|nr:HNH endonuclease [Bacillus cereus]PFD75195.1 restriction endonuclease [Bacillus cereus]PFV12847.1 restriction endonuclease [Bacillus cereus]PGV46623.1 restriction endonuclease [Bacillus cereus]